MNHQPFRDWLLSEDTLSAEQARSLQDHLAECESCSQIVSAWKEVETVIQMTPQAGPVPGFTGRWHAHLAEYEHHRQKRQGWVSIGITAFVAVALLTILVYQTWQVVQDPAPLIAVWLNRLVSLVSNYFILRNLFTSSTWFQPVYILFGSFLLVGMICVMSVLWMTAYKKIFILRRIE
jgi:hypothetical protein